MMPHNHNHWIACTAEHAHEPFDKRFSPIVKQGLGGSHAAGSARRENNTGDHFNRARRLSWAKMDFESLRQSISGARRTAIISATTEIAISSGVSAPISKPIGAKTL